MRTSVLFFLYPFFHTHQGRISAAPHAVYKLAQGLMHIYRHEALLAKVTMARAG